MTLSQLLLILLLVIVTLGVGAGVMILLHRHPSWATPAAGAIAAMGLIAAVVAVLVAITRK
ncbi:hypothetical protein [Streptomyces sp. UNOC14_S4]|uniref:hypothetical protein n=1 Tax=Streptomyces sp. UNOC14_S4 TaxID=2872340 RepID=UPI001E2C604E|nr:hypothetical protein [Streptomyces sp. UNOC14_S4]MCC3769389.1 hypothetical protein [Streptomyces sp. UNOC14_S4]